MKPLKGKLVFSAALGVCTVFVLRDVLISGLSRPSNELIYQTARPWPNDSQCNEFETSFFTDQSRPPMALASYPASGNSWVRQLIEGLTGRFTGSVYNNTYMFKRGMFGERMPPKCNCTIVQKTHWPNSGANLFKGSGILIIRNPYKAFPSFKNFLQKKDHFGIAPANSFTGPAWDAFVANVAAAWTNFCISWIKAITVNGGGIIYYEELEENRSEALRRLMKYLDWPVDERRLDCVLRNDPETFKRKVKSSVQDPYTDDHRKKIDQSIRTVQSVLQQHNFDTRWIQRYVSSASQPTADANASKKQ